MMAVSRSGKRIAHIVGRAGRRIAACATVAVGVAATATGAGAGGSDALRLIVTDNPVPLVPNSVMDLAAQLGFYFNEGLEVEIIRVQQTPSAIAALRSGHGDMANVSTSAALQLVARDQMKLKAVISPNKSIPFLIAAKREIETVEALNGRTFGVGRIGSLDHSQSVLVLKSLGMNAESLKMVAIGQPQVRAQALLGGRVDATTISIGVWTVLQDKSALKVLVPQDDYFRAAPVVSKVNVVTDNVLAEKGDKVARFVRAIMLASREFARNPKRWAEAMSKARPDVKRAELDSLAEAYVRSWSVNGGLNLEEIAYTVEREYERKDFAGLRRVANEEWLDTSYIDRALKEVGPVPGMDEPAR